MSLVTTWCVLFFAMIFGSVYTNFTYFREFDSFCESINVTLFIASVSIIYTNIMGATNTTYNEFIICVKRTIENWKNEKWEINPFASLSHTHCVLLSIAVRYVM